MARDLKAFAAKVWRDWVRVFLVVLVVVGTFRSAIADWNDVPTGSMKPTILEGDRILVNKLAYDLKIPFTTWRVARWGDPQRGDIVVLFSPADGKRLVKRVIGMPGDRIMMLNDRLFINGAPVSYRPIEADLTALVQPGSTPRRLFAEEELGAREHPVMLTPTIPALRSFGPLDVPAGSYFVMGDNRDESGDSRYFGFVKRDRIVGRAVAIAASVDPSHYYLPRWRRFGRSLP